MTTLYMVNLIITICSNIIFHIGDSGTIDCRNQQCQEMELYCTANENCSIDCAYDDGDGEACQDAIFHCPTGYTCTLNCGGSESCDRVQIDASQSTALGVSCSDARESCKQMQIDCPSTSTLSSQPNCHIKGDNTNNANGIY